MIITFRAESCRSGDTYHRALLDGKPVNAGILEYCDENLELLPELDRFYLICHISASAPVQATIAALIDEVNAELARGVPPSAMEFDK